MATHVQDMWLLTQLQEFLIKEVQTKNCSISQRSKRVYLYFNLNSRIIPLCFVDGLGWMMGLVPLGYRAGRCGKNIISFFFFISRFTILSQFFIKLVLLYCKLFEDYSQTNFPIIKTKYKKGWSIFRPKWVKINIFFIKKIENKHTHYKCTQYTNKINSVLFSGRLQHVFSRAFNKLNEQIYK